MYSTLEVEVSHTETPTQAGKTTTTTKPSPSKSLLPLALKLGIKQRYPFSPILFNIFLSSTVCNKARPGNNKYTVWKGRNKTFPYG